MKIPESPAGEIPPLKEGKEAVPSLQTEQTVTIQILKHLQQGTGLLKRMRWSGPKVRVFRLSRDMEYLERESLNFLSFEPTRIPLDHIKAMENTTASTADPELAAAGFCLYYDPNGRGRKTAFFDCIAPTGADYILWTKGLRLLLETRAKSKSEGQKLKRELLELTLDIPITTINHWFVQHFPNGCMDDGDDKL
uniref:PH domain-containing protein n=1 Tax=Lotharella oceanica TaxID=641309 RepID=A0A7S2U0Y0_9EUKA|mmetsp:Transcript_5099/g.10110  ORF Transcript_5099/g.10110 Transcript_5099/m.10110 type:complete len:194 (-) Transcript_5099:252-833(-)